MIVKIKSKLIFSAAAAFIAIGAGGARAQSASPEVSANEEFELNIAADHIVETAFERSTAVAVEGQDITVRVGAYTGAGRIDLTLRGVTGRVRFRASLEPVRERLERFRNRFNSR